MALQFNYQLQQLEQTNKQYLPIVSLLGIMMPITVLNPNTILDKQLKLPYNKQFIDKKLSKFNPKKYNSKQQRTNYKILND